MLQEDAGKKAQQTLHAWISVALAIDHVGVKRDSRKCDKMDLLGQVERTH